MRSAQRLLGGAALSALALTGCGARGVHVADLKDHPHKYEDRTVSLAGVVTTSWGIPLVPFKFYKIDDGTGEITVLSQSSRSAPARGSHVRVKGTVGEVATLGGQSIGLHLTERDRSRTDR